MGTKITGISKTSHVDDDVWRLWYHLTSCFKVNFVSFPFTLGNMTPDVSCYCGVGARKLVTKKEGKNKGRWFWTVRLCKCSSHPGAKDIFWHDLNVISVQQDNVDSSNGTTAHREKPMQPHCNNKTTPLFNQTVPIITTTAVHWWYPNHALRPAAAAAILEAISITLKSLFRFISWFIHPTRLVFESNSIPK